MRGFGIPVLVRASAFALLAVAIARPSFGATKHAAPSAKLPFLYDTTGIVDLKDAPGSITGPNVLQFQGVTNATFTPGSTQPIQLGQFVVPTTATLNGQATTYDETPFEIQVRTPEFDKTNTVPILDKIFPTFGKKLSLKSVIENSLLIKGVLNGTVSPTGQSNVTVTVDSMRPGGMDVQTQDHVTHYAFPIRFSALKLPPSWTMEATTPTARPAPAAEMLAIPAATPEPSTLASFAAILGGLALARRRIRG